MVLCLSQRCTSSSSPIRFPRASHRRSPSRTALLPVAAALQARGSALRAAVPAACRRNCSPFPLVPCTRLSTPSPPLVPCSRATPPAASDEPPQPHLWLFLRLTARLLRVPTVELVPPSFANPQKG
ncbi:hypothetical protein J5N97_020570 [Dioscorea zingiberensis]|uniref:Uncharacterized protein n=1 Tax=Dioscorea zingiberensis TaxID=325984 RepID=A0A9D5CG41_9LILI|nr:hypothetical protein J5N97_020570 [Dioscorea zingiberensis]